MGRTVYCRGCAIQFEGEVKESMEVSMESVVQCGKSDDLDQEQTVAKN